MMDMIDIENIQKDLYNMEKIAEEIAQFTNQPIADVWRRLCLELEQTGFNVKNEAQRFNVTPFFFDENMIRLYLESDGFIFETLVESRNPNRINKWLNIIKFVQKETVTTKDSTPILVFGDSVGSDCIFLKQLGYDVYYHDLEGYCSHFAEFRFTNRSIEIKKLSNYPNKKFKFVICLEVAEHVPNPKELIQEISSLTLTDGFCIFSEAFWLINENFPTHLKSNFIYVNKTDQLFEDIGMYVYWRDIHDKPIIYTHNLTSGHYIYSNNVNPIQKRFYKLIRNIIKKPDNTDKAIKY